MHKKQIRKAIKHLRSFSKELDKEKHKNPKLYESREAKFEPTYKKILKL